ncbi:MAG: hypothetical protein R3202_02365 [Candidatus Competibacterales bacterium]|nr:hypothetical protein [Candidatus Competibacterales bacterium]
MNILVLGKAKTGTSYISKCLQNALLPCDYHLEPKEGKFFFERTKSRSSGNRVVKIIFEHWNSKPHLRKAILCNETDLKFDRKVVIVRDPRDEMISRLMYLIYAHFLHQGFDPELLESWLATLKAKEDDPQAHSFLSLKAELDRLIGRPNRPWHDALVFQYAEFIHNISDHAFVVRYEDFIDGRHDELSAYLGFLPDPRLNQKEALIVRTKRSGTHGNWKEFFTGEDIEFLRPRIGGLMADMGYHDWELEPKSTLDHATYSDYVERLAGMARRDKAREGIARTGIVRFLDRLGWLLTLRRRMGVPERY